MLNAGTVTWLLAATIGCMGCGSAGYAQQPRTVSKLPEDVHVVYIVGAYFQSKYRRRPDFKAIAVAPDGGGWFAAYGKRSERIAKNTAISRCQKRLKKARLNTIRKRKCHLFAVGDEIVFKGPLPELPFGTTLGGPDVPLKRPLYDRGPLSKPKGILVFLHGCNRIRGPSQKVVQTFP